MKHLEVCQKYSAARRIFNSLLGVSSGDETLHLMFDILLHKLNKPLPTAFLEDCKLVTEIFVPQIVYVPQVFTKDRMLMFIVKYRWTISNQTECNN